MNDIALKTQGQPLPGLKLIKTKTFGLSTPTLRYVTLRKQTTSDLRGINILKAIIFCFCRNLK